jgi:hypothetical protein
MLPPNQADSHKLHRLNAESPDFVKHPNCKTSHMKHAGRTPFFDVVFTVAGASALHFRSLSIITGALRRHRKIEPIGTGVALDGVAKPETRPSDVMTP